MASYEKVLSYGFLLDLLKTVLQRSDARHEYSNNLDSTSSLVY